MPLRFLIDENLTPMLASWLTGTLGFDAVHVNDVGLRGASDPAVLAYAVAERRVVMTSNADDFRKLMRAVPGHPGLPSCWTLWVGDGRSSSAHYSRRPLQPPDWRMGSCSRSTLWGVCELIVCRSAGMFGLMASGLPGGSDLWVELESVPERSGQPSSPGDHSLTCIRFTVEHICCTIKIQSVTLPNLLLEVTKTNVNRSVPLKKRPGEYSRRPCTIMAVTQIDLNGLHGQALWQGRVTEPA